MSKPPTYESRVTDGVTEYLKDGEKIAFLNDQGNIQATHGNAGEKEGLKAWLDTQEPEAPIIPDAPVEVAPPVIEPAPEPGTARFDFIKDSAPTQPIPVRDGPLEVPTKEPRLIPGLGYLAPEYLRWAWHQPDEVFVQIYKKDKEQFKKDHGGYLEKSLNRRVNGGLQ